MSKSVIKVENLGKRFLIDHLQQEHYKTLRDVISDKVKGIGGNTKRLIQGNSAPDQRSKEEFWALKDINFDIHQGDRVGVIGRNGAGKSTLLKLLSRITEPTTGRIGINGRVASLLEVGTGFHPELSGRENIFLNGAILGMSRGEIRKKFDEIVAFAEIERFLDTPVKRYSSGMYVRLAFAVAAHLESEILIVDEVLAVGDAEFQKKCLGKLGEISEGHGRTVLFVSHNIAAIKALCDKGIFLQKGALNAIGNIDNVVEAYLGNTGKQSVFINDNNVKDKAVHVKSVKLVNLQSEILLHHPHTQPFFIEVEYDIIRPITKIFFAFHIHDSNLETIVFSRDFEYDEGYLAERQPGSYKLVIKIPVLLAPGSYTISLHVANIIAAPLITSLDYICPFDIIELNDDRSKSGFPIRGKVIASINWQTNILDKR